MRDKLGLTPQNFQPYNFERYQKLNPNLNEAVYKHLRQNGAEWKILCGLSVYAHWGCEMLKEVWWLKYDYLNTDFYKYRFNPEKYLKLTTW